MAKRHAVSEQSIYGWRKKFAHFNVDEVKRLKQVEAENARLMRLLVDRNLQSEVMKEINS